MRDLAAAADEAPSHFRIAHSSHSCTRGWVEERKGVCVCGIWRENHIKVRLNNDKSDKTLEGASADEKICMSCG